ncbi:MAG TPA: DUF5777 family beta-barrel protein [Terriglobales bacterium]|nr:DUF5777 family beta-barrel protein [Terriglobales bacterium]
MLLASSAVFGQNAPAPRQDVATDSSTQKTAAALGIHFVRGSSSTVLVERDGKNYLVDLAKHSIQELPEAARKTQPALREVTYSTSQPKSESVADEQTPRPKTEQKKHSQAYRPGDDSLFNLPTGRRLDRRGLVVDFSHRFPYEAAFTGTSRGATLLGLDDFSVSSFGFRYGVTRNFSVSAYRAPSITGRVIELGATYHLLTEQDHKPFNAALRFSVDGQNNFERNFTTNFELLLSRSITRRAQIYLVPMGSLHNRPLLSQASIVNAPPELPCSLPLATGSNPALNIRPCADTFSLGAGISLDVRPTVALIAEVIPTLVNAEDLGIHRPPFAFGIQKKIFRHAFTFGFSTGPGTTTSQRISTRASYLGQPGADVPSGMFVGFNLNRQLH